MGAVDEWFIDDGQAFVQLALAEARLRAVFKALESATHVKVSRVWCVPTVSVTGTTVGTPNTFGPRAAFNLAVAPSRYLASFLGQGVLRTRDL